MPHGLRVVSVSLVSLPPPQAGPFPFTCSLEVKPSGESLVLDFPELGRKIRVSYSFCFSAETCSSRVSSFSAHFPPKLCSPHWAQGCADLGLRVRSPVPTLRPRDPQLGTEVPDTKFLPFSKRALRLGACGFMLCWVVSEARPRCSPSSWARLRVRTSSLCLPPGRRGGVAGGWVSSLATTRRAFPVRRWVPGDG